jgi:chromatin remodeling complex protein RSC6
LHCQSQKPTKNHEPIKIPSENTLIEIFNHIPLKLFVVDKQQHIIHCTPHVSERNVIGKCIHDVPNTERISEQIYMVV